MLLMREHPHAPLPEKFHFINDICAIIYDQLTDLIANPEYTPHFNQTPLEIQPDMKKHSKS